MENIFESKEYKEFFDYAQKIHNKAERARRYMEDYDASP